MVKNIAIIGLGRLGSSILNELLGQKVKNIFVVDNNEVVLRNCISNFNGSVTGVSFDSMQKVFLEENGIAEMDVVIIAISDIQASIITSINLLDLGVKKIIVKATNDNHSRILKSLGIKEIIQADRIAAENIAKKAALSVNAVFQIIDDTYVSTKIKITNPDIDGESINSLKMNNTTSYSVVYVIRNKQTIVANNSTEIKLNDELIIIVKQNSINNIVSILTN